MTNNETILSFLIDRTNWKDAESVNYCFELAFNLDLSHMVDEILDRMNSHKNRQGLNQEHRIGDWIDAPVAAGVKKIMEVPRS